MMMPVMDGVATIRALRRIDPQIPMVAASGMLIHKQEAEGLGASVQAFLPKPFTAELLLRTLKNVIASHSRQAAR